MKGVSSIEAPAASSLPSFNQSDMQNQTLKPFIESLEKAIKSAPEGAERDQTGLIRSSRDGIIEVAGIEGLRLGEILDVTEAKAQALVMYLEEDFALAVVLKKDTDIREGQSVSATGRVLEFPVSDGLIGRVLDPLGDALDGGKPVSTKETRPHEQVAPGVMTRSPVDTPVQTGILSIDALIPIGRGQRELIIGDRQTGKTTIAIDTILSQKGQDMICVYVAIGQREARVAQVVETLKQAGAMDYTFVVSASASTPAVLQFLAPYAGVAAAEHFLHQGKDVLVIYDDLSKHAVAYRELSLLLRKPPGREAFPGDVFFIHSRLLERAVKLDESHGGGSITALPIIETQAGDVSAYIPTNVISITDGQIFLDTKLFYQGIRPAVNVGISVSRVGSAAQTHLIKKVSGTTKLDLAQYFELAAFSQFASELDEATKRQLVRGERTVEALKQKPGTPRALWQEAVILWTAKEGYLDETPKAEVAGKIEELLTHFASKEKALVSNMEKNKKLDEEVEEGLRKALDTYFKR
jgi:F-type H+-transporting ATPase subunit alpha